MNRNKQNQDELCQVRFSNTPNVKRCSPKLMDHEADQSEDRIGHGQPLTEGQRSDKSRLEKKRLEVESNPTL